MTKMGVFSTENRFAPEEGAEGVTVAPLGGYDGQVQKETSRETVPSWAMQKMGPWFFSV